MRQIIAIALLLMPICALAQFRAYTSTRNTDLSLYEKGIKIADGYNFICYEVWVKEEPKEGELKNWRNEQIKRRTKSNLTTIGFETLGYEKTLYHIDCVSRKLRIEKVIKYGENGDPIFSFTNRSHKWDNEVPESVGVDLIDAVCKYVSENNIK